jgi:hypothetical protein
MGPWARFTTDSLSVWGAGHCLLEGGDCTALHCAALLCTVGEFPGCFLGLSVARSLIQPRPRKKAAASIRAGERAGRQAEAVLYFLRPFALFAQLGLCTAVTALTYCGEVDKCYYFSSCVTWA